MTWVRLVVWIVIGLNNCCGLQFFSGLLIYFVYGYWNSKVEQKQHTVYTEASVSFQGEKHTHNK